MRAAECMTVRGVFSTNCYIITDGSDRCIVVDPGFEGGRIADRLQSDGLSCEYILLTHGHFDHMCGVPEIRKRYGCPVLAYRDSPYLTDAELNLSAGFGMHATVPDPVWIDEGELPGRWQGIKVVHTPGHTPDSVTFYDMEGGYALVGDTIFKGSVGNWQYPGGNRCQLVRSIAEKIFALPDDTVLLSGHSEPTTVGEEKRRYGFH